MRVKIRCHTLDHHVGHKVIEDDEMTLILIKSSLLICETPGF